MGGARHSARRPTLTVDPKLRQTILDIEQLLKDGELTSQALTGDDATPPSNFTTIATPSFPNVWTVGSSQFELPAFNVVRKENEDALVRWP